MVLAAAQGAPEEDTGGRGEEGRYELHKTNLGLKLEGAEPSIIQPPRSHFWL